MEQAREFCSRYRSIVAKKEGVLDFNGGMPAVDETLRWITVLGLARTKAEAQKLLLDETMSPTLLSNLSCVCSAAHILHEQTSSSTLVGTEDRQPIQLFSSTDIEGIEDIHAAAERIISDESFYGTEVTLFPLGYDGGTVGTACHTQSSSECYARLKEEEQRLMNDIVRFDTELASLAMAKTAPLLSGSDVRPYTTKLAEESARTCEALDDFSRMYDSLREGGKLCDEPESSEPEPALPTKIGLLCTKFLEAADSWYELGRNASMAIDCIDEFDNAQRLRG